VTIGYALELAAKGWRRAAEENPALARGINTAEGQITYQAVAEAHGLEHVPLERLLG
jgi:alanine dehydrogenase